MSFCLIKQFKNTEGLQNCAKKNKDSSVRKEIHSLLPHKHIFSSKTVDELNPVLLAACAGYFC